MNELIVRISGDVVESNFEAYKKDIIKVIDGVNTDLKTDEDFAKAETDTKKFKEAEKAIADVKDQALKQTKSINDLFSAMEEISEKLRTTRLDLEKQVKNKKAEIKDKLVKDSISNTKDEINEIGLREAVDNFIVDNKFFTNAIKGKKTVASMEKSLNECSQGILKKFQDFNALVKSNKEYLKPHKEEHPNSFHDYNSLVIMEGEALEKVVDSRILAAKQEAEAKKQKEAAEKVKEQNEKAASPVTVEPEPFREPEKRQESTDLKEPEQVESISSKFVMTIEMDCEKSIAVEIAKIVDSSLKEYSGSIKSINLRVND